MKMHLCGVLVHSLGLYCHIWVDAHHKHDINQVVTSMVKVLGDVKNPQCTLPPTLCIIVHEKTKTSTYLRFAFALWGWGTFEKCSYLF